MILEEHLYADMLQKCKCNLHKQLRKEVHQEKTIFFINNSVTYKRSPSLTK